MSSDNNKIKQTGFPNYIQYSSKLECLIDNSKETRKFLDETKIKDNKFFKAELDYLVKCQRSKTKFVRLSYKNGYFFTENLSIFDKKEGKNESKSEGQYTLSCGVSNVVKYMEKCQKLGVFTKRNFDKILRDLKACEKGNYRYITRDINFNSIDIMDILRKDNVRAYLRVSSYND